MIRFAGVSKTFPGGGKAVQDLDLEVQQGEVMVLLGTSGSGKTTAMKMVNRLIEPTAGKVEVEGTDVRRHDPIELRRRIGYAVQGTGLFPHFDVRQNVAAVPRLLGWPDERIEARIDELLEMVGLDAEQQSGRYAHQLSGGQQQRVGVARALAADPAILLMDEPFGALDPITRNSLQREFYDLQQRLGKTILFVTHDVSEAFLLGDRIALLDEGRLRQLGTPRELLAAPSGAFSEKLLGPQRIQLVLELSTLDEIIDRGELEPAGTGEAPARLELGTSLAAALNTFELHESDRLPVFDRQQRLGDLQRDKAYQLVRRAAAVQR